MMSEKRFKLINGVKKGTHSGIWDNQKQHNIGISDELWVGEVVAMLNEGVALAEENKKLKYKLRNCEDARASYKQDWKACSSYCDEYKNEIISLKDEVEGLIGENKELKKENEQLRKKLEQIYSFKGLNCRCVNGV